MLPTVFLSRYRDQDRMMYKVRTAKRSTLIVNSIPVDLMATKAPVVDAPSIIVLTNHGIPSDIKMASELAPREFDTPKAPSPAKKERDKGEAKFYQPFSSAL